MARYEIGQEVYYVWKGLIWLVGKGTIASVFSNSFIWPYGYREYFYRMEEVPGKFQEGDLYRSKLNASIGAVYRDFKDRFSSWRQAPRRKNKE